MTENRTAELLIPTHDKCPIHSWVFRFFLLATVASFGGFSSAEGKTLSAKNLPGFGNEQHSRLVIRDMEIVPPEPMFKGERFVLTTIGSEHENTEELEFHPLVSILIDYSFPEVSQGQWLAFWNLGRQTPGIKNSLTSVLPGVVTTKRTNKKQLKKLQAVFRKLQKDPNSFQRKIPEPLFKVTATRYRGKEHLLMGGVKWGLRLMVGLGWKLGPVTYLTNLMYRNYLLRHKDWRERDFEQAYLGLLWYTDLAYSTPGNDSLSAEDIVELKFRLVSSRDPFGRWITREKATDFVNDFESQMRENMWGTSSYLASIANYHHLGYEEFQRPTTEATPVSLGGILYYDPILAPEPSQVKWPIFNPFDLRYNPFQHQKIQEAASLGQRVPLAIYVYQSNLVLKPIIAVDFLDTDNPRIREKATYWHRLGDQALSFYSFRSLKGIIACLVNKSLSFLANRKGLTYFSDAKQSLGLEEFRLSIMSHLYSQEKRNSDLADALDRVLIHPFSQPTRLQAVRAQIQHLQLSRPEFLVQLGRRLRNQKMSKVVQRKGKKGDQSLESYRGHLERQQALKTLRVFRNDKHLPSLPIEQITKALHTLSLRSNAPDREVLEFLKDFRLEVHPNKTSILFHTEQLLDDIDKVLVNLYEAEGLDRQKLASDLHELEKRKERKREKTAKKIQRKHVKKFQRMTKRHLKVLKNFSDSNGNLIEFPPGDLIDSLNFFAEAVFIIEHYPKTRTQFRKLEPQLKKYLNQTLKHLSSREYQENLSWMEQYRLICLKKTDYTYKQLSPKRKSYPSHIYNRKVDDNSFYVLQENQQ